jgi:hypothetical protein
MTTTQIGCILFHAGFVTAEQIEQARRLRVQRMRCRTKDPHIGDILVELGHCTPKQLKWALQEQARLRGSLKKHEAEMERAHLALEEMWAAALSI